MHDPVFDELALLEHAMSDNRKHVRHFLDYCVNAEGEPFEVDFGDDRYDSVKRVIANAVASWRFAPRVVDGVPVDACTRQIMDIDYWWVV